MMDFKRTMLAASAALFLNLSAYSQNVTMQVRNVTVKEAMEQFKRASGYSFVFSSSDVNTAKKVTVSANNASVADVVRQILRGQNGVDYDIQGKNVVVRKRQAPAAGQQGKGQRRTVRGQILDQNGEPIIGASVKQKGTGNGAVTDVNGNFVIEGVSPDSELLVSYIGFTPQTVKVGQKDHLSIAMREDSEQLSEVVVVGYGSQRKENLTGSVSSV